MKNYRKKYDGMNPLIPNTGYSYGTPDSIPYLNPRDYIQSISTPPELRHIYDTPDQYINLPEDLTTPYTLTDAIREINPDIVELLINSGVEITIGDIILAIAKFEENEDSPGMNENIASIVRLCIANYQYDFKPMAFIILSFLLHQGRNVLLKLSIIKFILKESITRNINIFESSGDITSCRICLEEYDDDDPDCIVFLCGHNIHKKCAEKWFETDIAENDCPVCKTNVNPLSSDFPPYLTCKEYKDLIRQRQQLVEGRTDGSRKRRKSKSRKRKSKKRKSKSKRRKSKSRKRKSKSRKHKSKLRKRKN
jgi:hypothetical protein